jgi:hypothetical protein
MRKPITDDSLLTVRTLKEAFSALIEPHFAVKNAELATLRSQLAAATQRAEALERVAEAARALSKALEVPIWGSNEGESWCQEHEDLRAALSAAPAQSKEKP